MTKAGPSTLTFSLPISSEPLLAQAVDITNNNTINEINFNPIRIPIYLNCLNIYHLPVSVLKGARAKAQKLF